MISVHTILYIAELVGVVASAISGVLTAAQGSLDLVGAMTLGCITAVGGGIIRDLLLGNIPPASFRNPIYILLSCGVSVLFFFLEYFFGSRLEHHKQRYEQLLNIFDAIGLSVYVIVGVDTAVKTGYSNNALLSIFVGTITGVGGGILRDMMIGKIPVVLQKRVYAVAAVLGASVYWYLLHIQVQTAAAAGIAVALILCIRYLATHYRWNLPRYPRV